MALTVSFRRTLLFLLFVMVFLIFVVYWSQNGSNDDNKPSNGPTGAFGAKYINSNNFDRRRQLSDILSNKILV